MNRFQKALLLFLAGAIFGTLGDVFHVLSGTLDYYRPSGLMILPPVGQPFWVPLLFGAAGLGIGMSHSSLDPYFGTQPQRPGLKNLTWVLLGTVALLATWAASGFLPWATGGAKDAFMAAVAVGTWLILDRSWQGLALGIATALIGTAVEITLVRSGQFYYLPHAANSMGVPSWLPWLYLCASVSVGNLGRILNR